uniref:uncharacterized protein LOC113475444 n=1 Tax=Ciona intestinalis TaxID=7719 RepID=UPI000EF5326D|nr:uncharacterized protein LOC113475444 [Ciona intestinalis]|eukprot:XP_026695418.1 uncharacterized protein LOC113475444 [Ciona intestinalis]
MASSSHDFVQDEVSELERILAQKLKDLCKGGKEMNGTKPKAAPIFYDLAKIYNYKPKDKMLNMTRSAALYNAAIVRDPENQRFKDELKALCSAVLETANVANRDADLISLAAEVKNKLNDLRKDFGESYNQLDIIPYGLEGEQLIETERKKVLDVKNLQQQVTRRYTELMRFISDECIKIMGAPPCKYAVVGLGSLARSEITPYSDFEHIIVLDNDVAKMEDRKMIMKYFRWFTTIFNIILINLGETMINCVAIPSINPKYRDWFTDTVTPNGVTFDGMVAHACIRPLGRPATKEKPWNTEFIKPVDEMVQYLDSDEELKEGYHVADALYKACFVAGDEVICAEYQEKAHLRLKENDETNEFFAVYKQMEKDLKTFNIFDQQTNVTSGLQNFNLKKVIYRGATIFVSALSRFYSLSASSCFDVIDELDKHPDFNKEVAHQLRFMVAVACEVRAKLYHKEGQQDDIFMEDFQYNDIVTGLIEIIGKQSLVSLTEALYLMHIALTARRYASESVQNESEELVPNVSAKLVQNVSEYTIEKKVGMKPLLFHCRNKNLFKIAKMQPTFLKLGSLTASDLEALLDLEEKTVKLHALNAFNFREDVISMIKKVIPTLPRHEFSLQFYYAAIRYASFYDENDLALELTTKLIQLDIKQHRINPDFCNPTAEAKFELKVQELKSVVDRSEEGALRLVQELNEMVEALKPTMFIGIHLMMYVQLLRKLNHGQQAQKVLEKLLQIEEVQNEIPYHRDALLESQILIEYTITLLCNRNYQRALIQLNKIKQILEPHKKLTVTHMVLYDVYGRYYHCTDRYMEAMICYLEHARIGEKIKEPILDEVKQNIRSVFILFAHHFI